MTYRVVERPGDTWYIMRDKDVVAMVFARETAKEICEFLNSRVDLPPMLP